MRLLELPDFPVVEAQHFDRVLRLVPHMRPVTARELGVGLVLHQAGLQDAKQRPGRIFLLQALHARTDGGALLLGVGEVIAAAGATARDRQVTSALAAFQEAREEILAATDALRSGEALQVPICLLGPLRQARLSCCAFTASQRASSTIRMFGSSWVIHLSLGFSRETRLFVYLKATREVIAAGHPPADIDDLLPWAFPKAEVKAAA